MVSIRPVKLGDGEQLYPLIRAYLEETKGGSFLPTQQNGCAFLMLALDGAHEGDPCLVAEVDGKLVGYTIVRGVPLMGFETLEHPCRGYGTYVLPEFRQKGLEKGVAMQLFEAAIVIAQSRGYTSYQMIATFKESSLKGIRLLQRAGARITGSVYEIDLTEDWKLR
jgi:GNAT superfamily N-acetyltransferase